VYNLKKDAIARLKNSIASLHRNTLKRIKILIADASTKSLKSSLIQNNIEFDSYIHKPQSKKLNKSKIINLGFKYLVQNDYFIFSDIDIIFPVNFIKDMLYFHQSNSDVYTYGILSKLPQDQVNDANTNYEHLFAKYRAQCKGFHDEAGYGFWMASSKAFEEVKGFDERYVGWGCEDNDFDFRIKLNNNIGKKKCCSYIVGLHQYHDPNIKNFYNEDTDKNKKILKSSLSYCKKVRKSIAHRSSLK